MEHAVDQLWLDDFELPEACLTNEELLASALFPSIPMDRAADAAFNLVRRYRSISEVVSQASRELRKQEGVCETTSIILKTIHALHVKMLREYLGRGSFDENLGVVRNYCESQFQAHRVSVFQPFYLRGDKLALEGEVEFGSISEICVYSREIVKQAILNDCDGVYVVFGRKYGLPIVTEEEQLICDRLEAACSAVGQKFIGAMAVVTE